MAIAEMYGAPFRLALAAEEADRRAANDRFRMEMMREANRRERERWEQAQKNAPAAQELAAATLRNQIEAQKDQEAFRFYRDRDTDLDAERKLRFGIPLTPEDRDTITKMSVGMDNFQLGPANYPVPKFNFDPTSLEDARRFVMQTPETEDDKRWLRGFRLAREAQEQAAAKRGGRGTLAMERKDMHALMKNELMPHLTKFYGDKAKDYLDGMTEQLAQIENSEQYQSMTPQERAKVPAALVKNFWYRNASQKERSEFEERETEDRLSGLYLKQWANADDDDRKSVKSAYSKYSPAAEALEKDLATGKVARGSAEHLQRLREIDKAWNGAKGIGKFKSPVYNELLHLEYDHVLKELQAAEAEMMRDYPRWYKAVKNKHGEIAIDRLGGKFGYSFMRVAPPPADERSSSQGSEIVYGMRDLIKSNEDTEFYQKFIPRLRKIQKLRDALKAREGWIEQNETMIADGK